MAQRRPLEHYIDKDLPTTANKHFDLENATILGSGMSGSVYLYQDQVHGSVAVKWFRLKEGASPNGCSLDKTVRMFKAEVSVMRSCKHPNVMTLLSACRTKDAVCILMPFMSGGSLVKAVRSLTLQQTVKYFFQIADAVKYLHEKKIFHGDIKPANVLINDQDQAVLTDFGLSRCVPNHSVEVFITDGTKGYLAPEVNGSTRVNPFQVDMYALGMTLWTMTFNKSPRMCQNHLELVEQGNLTPSLKHMLRSLLQKDPTLRPTAAQVTSGEIP